MNRPYTKVSPFMVSLSPKGISYGARTICSKHFDKLSANGKYKQTFVDVPICSYGGYGCNAAFISNLNFQEINTAVGY